MRRLLVGSVVLTLPIAAAFAMDEVVSDSRQVLLGAARNTMTMASVKMDEYPSELGTPIFWLDASQTNGWEVAADGTVVRVPSLVGDRYLTSDVTEPGTSWSTWNSGNADQTLKPPYFITNVAALGGGNAIDFGAQAAGRGLLFNAVEQSDGSGVKNHLETIGSVVAVYDSTDGGGFFLSGGKGNGMDWGRSYSYTLATASKGTTDYCNFFVNHKLAADDAKFGMYWQDDLFGAVANGGLGGQWQVIAYSPRATLPFAVGLGIGCTQKWYKSYSGGMKIAEMLIFDKVISEADLRKIGVWLQKKWFNRAPAGYNGRAQVASVRAYYNTTGSTARNAVVDLTVDAGDTLEIGSFTGGRAHADKTPADLRKMGEGTLQIRDIRDYNGNVTLAGGTFRMAAKRPVPTVDELPKGIFVRIDPSVDESRVDVDEDGKECVAAIGSVGSMTRLGERIWARGLNPGTAGETPALLRDELGPGLHVLDFGPSESFANGGRQLLFATNQTLGASVDLPGVCTVVALVGAQQAGGHILDGVMFKRGYQWVRQNDGTHTYALLNPTAVYSGDAPRTQSPQAYGTLYIDGEKRAQDAGYPTPTYHVLAMQVPQCYVRGIARWSDTWCGGLKLGELILFNRPLSEAELLDTQAYLAKKWLGRTLPGYQEVTTVADVQNVIVAEPSTIEVPAGDTVRIAKLTARARLEKTGAGTLIVGPESDTTGVVVREGAVKTETNPPDVSSKCELAAGDAFHLDANVAKCFDLMLGHESENRITCWNDVKFRNCAWQFALAKKENVLKHPTLTTAPELGGKPVVDFGPYSVVTDNGQSGHMFLEKGLDSVRSVYLVIGSAENGGNPLGTYSTGTPWGVGDFARDGEGSSTPVTMSTPWFSAANANVKAGKLYINGVETAFADAIPSGGYDLVELHTAAGASFSEMGRNLVYYDLGGFTLGEMIVYERELTEREKRATRNYLMKKWFDKTDDELVDLPEKPVIDPTANCRTIVVDEDQALDVSDPIHARKLTGDATLVKTGGTLSVDDLSDFEGTLAVADGTVKLSGLPLAVAPKLLEAGRILHLDATRNVTVSTNADHTVSVSEWASVLDDGWTAVPGESYGDKKTHLPTLLQNELNDLPVVKMTYHGWNKGEEYMLFQTNGVQAMLKDIRSVFWVIGSQEGGGFLLGGGLKNNNGKSTAAWCRKGQSGGRRGQSADDGLIDSSFAQDDLYAWSDWRLNGGEIFTNPGEVGLSGGYDVLSMVEWTTTDPKHRSWNPASADGLAFDGRILNGENWQQHCGNQRLAELVIYDTFVTGEDRLATEAYLSSKWGLSQKCPTNAATVALAAGTTLVSEKGSQYVGKLVGEGTVEGDVTVGAFVADAAATSLLSIDGTLTIPPAVSFDVRNLVFDVEPVTIPVCTATACEGVENLRNATFVGLSDDCRARAKFMDGTLVVVVKGRGMSIIIR